MSKISKVKLNKQNQFNFNVSFNQSELDLMKDWTLYCKENYFTRVGGIKRLIKQELKEQRLVLK